MATHRYRKWPSSTKTSRNFKSRRRMLELPLGGRAKGCTEGFNAWDDGHVPAYVGNLSFLHGELRDLSRYKMLLMIAVGYKSACAMLNNDRQDIFQGLCTPLCITRKRSSPSCEMKSWSWRSSCSEGNLLKSWSSARYCSASSGNPWKPRSLVEVL